MTRKETYTLNKSYIFAFVGNGIVKCFKTKYETSSSDLYGSFDCGIQIRKDGMVDKEYITHFNIIDKRFNEYINCNLYVFSSKEKANELLPKIIKNHLDVLREKSEELMAEYMKTADDCNNIETVFNSIKNNTFALTNPFEN